MPEEFEGQHLALSSDLSDSKQKGRDRLSLELFLLSNNLVSHGPNGRSAASMGSGDRRVMEIFNESGWNNDKHLSILISSHEPTAEAISEKLFASALRLLDLKTVKRMLEAKMNPNTAVQTIGAGVLTPLQFASETSEDKSLELVQLLLTHGADANLSYNEHSALNYAIKKRHGNVIRLLLAHGVIVTPSCLSAAVSTIDDNLLRELIDTCSNVNEQTGWQGHSALAQAVKVGRVAIIPFLLAKGAEVNELITISFENDTAVTTVLGIAVWSKKLRWEALWSEDPGLESLEMIQLLLGTCENLNPDFDGLPYVSPLALAVEADEPQITEILLQAGVSVKAADDEGSTTLIERTTKKKNLALCQVLLNYGARIDKPLSDTEQTSSALLAAIGRKAFDIVELLINAGARLNDGYSQPPGTVLGAVIESGDRSLISKLLSAGARGLKTGQIRRIRNLDIAVHLQQEFEVFQGILQSSGQQILAAALFAKDENLAQYLLEHDADLQKGPGKSRSPITKTPLEAAIMTHNFVFVEALLNRGAMVTDDDLAAALYSNSKCPQNLLSGFRGSAPTTVGTAICEEQSLGILRDAGVDPTGVPQLFQDGLDLEDFDCNLEPPASVLEIAVVFGSGEDLKLLLQWAHWDKRLTGRALTIATFIKQHELADELLEYGADGEQEISAEYDEYDENDDLERRWHEIFTPLQAAVKNQLRSVAEKLVQSVDVNYLGEGARRRTPLQHAVENGNMDLIDLLLQHGARVDGPPARDGGATALQIAAIQGYIGIARRLIDSGASVNEPPARFNGRTALQGAAEHGRIDMLHMLFDEGALVVGDGEQHYQKAIQLGERNGHGAAVRLLRSFRNSIQLTTPEAI
jgi:ankyrin repeat protein